MNIKKIIILITGILFLSGCSTINSMSYQNIINKTKSDSNLSNVIRKGYKYYIPKGMKLVNNKDYNEIIMDQDNTYYLYVDVVSYYNNVKFDYKVNKDSYYSQKLDNGYLEINKLENDKYLIEIMDNYAKIEVIVDKANIKKAIAYSNVLISSVEYKYDVLDNLMKDDSFNTSEVEFNIFKTIKSDSDFATYEQMYGTYDETDGIKDSDIIE
ncbi:MAG: hypothetical protein J5892_02055 [Bacilli bacterium]|nr:hypothetical protein [Bacilli bacterium]